MASTPSTSARPRPSRSATDRSSVPSPAMARTVRFLVLVILAAGLLPATPALATTPSPGHTDRTVVSGLDDPTAMAVALDGRVFIGQQGGAVRIVKNGALLPNAFVNLTVDSSGERGVIGITLDSNFPIAPYV